MHAQHKIDAESAGIPGLSVATMVTSDGVPLDADVWTPQGAGPWPVLLMRQAYGRRIGSALCYAHPSWYARQGFMVVIQDVRGRGTSGGTFTAFENEGRDGAEAIAWAAALPGSNGRVGMFGFSYQGTNQLLAAAHRPAALCAMAPAMIGWDLHADWASEGGAFRLAPNIGWGIQMAAGSAQHQDAQYQWEELFAASRTPPLHSRINARPALLERTRRFGHYQDWLEHPAGDPYWARISPATAREDLLAERLPALFIGGWYDTHLPGTLVAFDALDHGKSALLVGPWTHFPWDRHVGDCDFGPEAVSRVDEAQVRWFRHWLLDDATDTPVPAIRVFDLGAKRWRTRPHWPEARRTLHLTGTGLASIDGEAGVLQGDAPAEPGIDYLVHDPWRPAPSVGGAFGTPPGPVNRVKVDNRSDVLTFTTAPLPAPVVLLGAVDASLMIVTDSASVDLACTLSRIDAKGAVFQLAEGYRSVPAPATGQRVAVSLRRTCATIAAGERLRLSIAVASFPAYPLNSGTGRAATETARSEATTITLGIVTGGIDGSVLHLAIDDDGDSDD